MAPTCLEIYEELKVATEPQGKSKEVLMFRDSSSLANTLFRFSLVSVLAFITLDSLCSRLPSLAVHRLNLRIIDLLHRFVVEMASRRRLQATS